MAKDQSNVPLVQRDFLIVTKEFADAPERAGETAQETLRQAEDLLQRYKAAIHNAEHGGGVNIQSARWCC